MVAVEVHGADKAVADLEAMAARAGDALPLWRELDLLFHEDEAARFEREGIPRWRKLAEATLEQKAKLGQPPEILRATGELMRSLTEGATGVEHSLPTRLVFGTDVPYARFHQYGTVKMPRRKAIGLTVATRKRMVGLLNEYIVMGVE
jgi:phage gpG-like protein